MKLRKGLLAAVGCLALVTTVAAPAATDRPNGTILATEQYALLPHERLPAWAKRRFPTPEAYAAMRDDAGLRLERLHYASDGLDVVAFLYAPRSTKQRLPVIVWNRGGVGEDTRIGNENFHDLYEMWRLASAGFVVIAPQYRGIDGGEGRDEVGGSDVNDIVNLLPLIRSLPGADADTIHLWGFSRGAMMTLQTLARGFPAKSAVVVGAPTDWKAAFAANPTLEAGLAAYWTDLDTDREGAIARRSAVTFVDRIRVPLLMIAGTADPAFPSRQTLDFAGRLDAAGRPFGVSIYAGDNHPVDANREARLDQTIAWFKAPPRLPIGAPMLKAYRSGGIAAAFEAYDRLKAAEPDGYRFDENQLNNFGYALMQQGRAADAALVFQRNAALFPASSNAWESLGEGLAAAGKTAEARKAFDRALQIDPANRDAIEALKKLNP